MLLIVFQDNFVMHVMHLLMLYGSGTVVWHVLRVYVEAVAYRGGGLGCSNPPPEILKISVESSIA